MKRLLPAPRKEPLKKVKPSSGVGMKISLNFIPDQDVVKALWEEAKKRRRKDVADENQEAGTK